MSNREVEVAVRADGVDDATGDLAPEDAGAGGGGGDGDRSGLSGALRGGLIGGLLSQVSSVTAVMEAILGVLNAFIAPFAIMALRLLAPVLRRLLGTVLPALQSFLRSDLASTLGEILTRTSLLGQLRLLSSLLNNASAIVSGIRNLPDRIGAFITSLPGDIGRALATRIPFVGSTGGPDADARNGVDLSTGFGGATDGSQALRNQGTGDTIIEFTGATGALIDFFEREANVDFFRP